MSEMQTFARPYAKGAFEYALEHNALGNWSVMLQGLAQVIRHPRVRAAISNPRYTRQQIFELLVAVIEDYLDEPCKNFVKLLVENKRIEILPDLVDLYEKMRAAYDKTQQVEVFAPKPLGEQRSQQLKDVLTKRLGRNVSLKFTIDTKMLGGIIVRAGDTVFDGSVKTKLAHLAESMIG